MHFNHDKMDLTKIYNYFQQRKSIQLVSQSQKQIHIEK